MIKLVCYNSYHPRTKKPCGYEVTYKKEGEIRATAKAVGGFDCPSCKRHTLVEDFGPSTAKVAVSRH